jgi:hypothetical protein
MLGAVVDGEAVLGAGDDVLAVDDRPEVLLAADLELQAARALEAVDLRPQRDAARRRLAGGHRLREAAAPCEGERRLRGAAGRAGRIAAQSHRPGGGGRGSEELTAVENRHCCGKCHETAFFKPVFTPCEQTFPAWAIRGRGCACAV